MSLFFLEDVDGFVLAVQSVAVRSGVSGVDDGRLEVRHMRHFVSGRAQRLAHVGLGVVVGLAVVGPLVHQRVGRCGERERFAVDHLAEGLAEVVRQEGVQDGVDARVHVGQHVRRDLNHNVEGRDLEQVQALEDQNQLNGTPADCEDDHDDDDHARHPLLAAPALGGNASARRNSAPQPHQHAQVQAADEQQRDDVRRGEECDLETVVTVAVLLTENAHGMLPVGERVHHLTKVKFH